MHIVRRVAFETMVSEVLDTIPPALADLIDNVAVFIEDQDPDDEYLMGYYDGIDTHDRSAAYSGYQPDRIVVFRLPHCRAGNSEAEVRKEVRATVLHEIAHYFGFSDEELQAMDRY